MTTVRPITFHHIPVDIFINHEVVLYWHCCMCHYLARIAIYGNHMRHSKHCQFFILIQVDLVPHIGSTVWDWIEVPQALQHK